MDLQSPDAVDDEDERGGELAGDRGVDADGAPLERTADGHGELVGVDPGAELPQRVAQRSDGTAAKPRGPVHGGRRRAERRQRHHGPRARTVVAQI